MKSRAMLMAIFAKNRQKVGGLAAGRFSSNSAPHTADAAFSARKHEAEAAAKKQRHDDFVKRDQARPGADDAHKANQMRIAHEASQPKKKRSLMDRITGKGKHAASRSYSRAEANQRGSHEWASSKKAGDSSRKRKKRGLLDFLTGRGKRSH